MEAPVAVTQGPAAKNGNANGSANGNGERSRAVDAAILQIEKQFGRGSIMRLGDREAQNVPAMDALPERTRMAPCSASAARSVTMRLRASSVARSSRAVASHCTAWSSAAFSPRTA